MAPTDKPAASSATANGSPVAPAATLEPATTGPSVTEPTTQPSESAAEPTTDPPTDPPTDVPTELPAASPVTEPASDCTGTDENRTFYGSVASAVAWTVYCPVLPGGWFVESGQYRLAGGGRLAIAYRGPGGDRFTLDEGAWSRDGVSCVPSGTDMGATAFGDREGTLIATDNGSFAIVVDDGASVCWKLAADGLDEATVRTFGAALIAVAE